LVIYGVLLAEGTAFAGFVFLGANLFRSRGGVIAFAVVVFLVFGVFFSILAEVVAASVAPLDAASILANAAYWNPTQLLNPALLVVVPQAATDALGVQPPPGQIGPYGAVVGNPALLAAAAVTWVAVPIALAFALDRYRD
jgi:hypothetical protein